MNGLYKTQSMKCTAFSTPLPKLALILSRRKIFDILRVWIALGLMALHVSRNKVFTDAQMHVHTSTYCFQLLFDIQLLKCATLADAWHPKLPLRPLFHSTSDFGWVKWDFWDPVLVNFRVLFLNAGSQNGVTWIKGLFYNPILNTLLLYLTVLEVSARQCSLVPLAKGCSVACEQPNAFPKHTGETTLHSTWGTLIFLAPHVLSVLPTHIYTTCGFSSEGCVKWH